MANGWVVAQHPLRPQESENIDQERLVERSFARPSPAQHGVATLAFLEEPTYAELTAHLYIPFGTVQSRLSCALAKLLGKEGP